VSIFDPRAKFGCILKSHRSDRADSKLNPVTAGEHCTGNETPGLEMGISVENGDYCAVLS
jgi:hypothetical protein